MPILELKEAEAAATQQPSVARPAQACQGRVLLLNQAFYPDVVSTAQHAMDLCQALSATGYEVTVVASNRGYDDPGIRFPREETWNGVRILRTGNLGLGKASRGRRAVDFACFMLTCAARVVSLLKFDVVIALTSPPLISLLGALLVPWKANTLVFWAMDLNPDEAIAAGWLRAGSVSARILHRLQLHSMRKAQTIIALDRFMKDRLLSKGLPQEKLVVVPPWSHDAAVRFDPEGQDAFRQRHGLEGKFVVMYSGNHSPCHPLDTLVRTAEKLADHPEIVFCFVGGGSEHRKLAQYVEKNTPANIRLFPYQPLEELSASLSAADLHAVVMGNAFPGIIHPCKIYNILAVGAPVLYIGPKESHITDIFKIPAWKHAFYSARHGEAGKVAEQVLMASREAARLIPPEHVLRSFSASEKIPEMQNAVSNCIAQRRSTP